MIIELKGRINEQGQLEVELPKDIPIGDVDITLKISPKKRTKEQFLALVDQIIEEQKPLLDELAKQ